MIAHGCQGQTVTCALVATNVAGVAQAVGRDCDIVSIVQAAAERLREAESAAHSAQQQAHVVTQQRDALLHAYAARQRELRDVQDSFERYQQLAQRALHGSAPPPPGAARHFDSAHEEASAVQKEAVATGASQEATGAHGVATGGRNVASGAAGGAPGHHRRSGVDFVAGGAQGVPSAPHQPANATSAASAPQHGGGAAHASACQRSAGQYECAVRSPVPDMKRQGSDVSVLVCLALIRHRSALQYRFSHAGGCAVWPLNALHAQCLFQHAQTHIVDAALYHFTNMSHQCAKDGNDLCRALQMVCQQSRSCKLLLLPHATKLHASKLRFCTFNSAVHLLQPLLAHQQTAGPQHLTMQLTKF